MKKFYVIVDEDDDEELVYQPTQRTELLEAIVGLHPLPEWQFEKGDFQVTIYPIAFYEMPTREQLEEVEYRALQVLGLE